MVTVQPGDVALWWDGAIARLGLVLEGGAERCRVRTVPGKERRVPAARLVLALRDGAGRPLDEESFPAYVESLAARAQELPIELVWELGREGATSPEAAGPDRELAGWAHLALGDREPESLAVVALALGAEPDRFGRRGESWYARSPREVAERRRERERAREREKELEELFGALSRLGRGEEFVASGSAAERRHLDALYELALEGETASASARKLASKAIGESGVAGATPQETAFRILRVTGRFETDDENLERLRLGLDPDFSPAVEEAARSAVETGFRESGRVDRTGLATFSIDGPRTREIDDLLSLEDLGEGSCRLGIHIADPAAWIGPGDRLDTIAARRLTTHYMPDLRVPMLPVSISEEAASLVAERVRPALSFFVEFDREGRIAERSIERSMVESRGRFDYGEVDERIERGGEHPFGPLARIGPWLEERRVDRGALILRGDDIDVWVDESGEPRIERLPARSVSRRAVTESMILAGELAARSLHEQGVPSLFRSQRSMPGSPRARVVEDPWVAFALRRFLRRADIGTEPARHAGLGLDVYSQATSPLRRYSDLVVTRQLGALLAGEAPPHTEPEMRSIAAAVTAAEQAARRAERNVNEYWLLRYLERRQDRPLEATLLERRPRPIVRLDETGLVRSLGGGVSEEPGATLTLRVERVNPRAGLLRLRLA